MSDRCADMTDGNRLLGFGDSTLLTVGVSDDRRYPKIRAVDGGVWDVRRNWLILCGNRDRDMRTTQIDRCVSVVGSNRSGVLTVCIAGDNTQEQD